MYVGFEVLYVHFGHFGHYELVATPSASQSYCRRPDISPIFCVCAAAGGEHLIRGRKKA